MKNNYLILAKHTPNFAFGTIFKVLGTEGCNYTVIGKNKKQNSLGFAIYNINLKQFPDGTWVTLDNFIKECTIIGKTFYREKPVVKPSLSGGMYKDICFNTKSNNNVLVAVYKNLWLYFDYVVNRPYFLDPEYIDTELDFADNDQKTNWSKDLIKSQLQNSVDEKFSKYYDDFSQN